MCLFFAGRLSKMHALLFSPNSILCGIPSSTSPAFFKSKICGKEIADGAHHVAFQFKQSLLNPSNSSIRSDGTRRGRPRRSISSDNDKEADALKDLTTTDNETKRPPNQDKIIALFSRIQSSISNEESAVSRRKNTKNSREKEPSESVSGSLQQYRRKKQMKDRSLKGIKESPQNSGTLEAEALRGAKTSRPWTNFVKKSPVPPTLDKRVVEEQSSKMDTNESLDLQKLDGMKLAQLKGLAKTKGVKGYSKLKKKELLELLKVFLYSSS